MEARLTRPQQQTRCLFVAWVGRPERSPRGSPQKRESCCEGLQLRLADSNTSRTHSQTTQRFRQHPAKTLGETLGNSFPSGIVDNVFRLDNFPRNVLRAAHSVSKSQFDTFLTCPHLAAEYFRPFFQAFTPALLNYLNELLMDITQHFLCIFLLLVIVGRKWIEKGLVFPCRDQPPFDAKFFHCFRKPEPVHQDANGPDDTCLVHIYLVCGNCHIITT